MLGNAIGDSRYKTFNSNSLGISAADYTQPWTIHSFAHFKNVFGNKASGEYQVNNKLYFGFYFMHALSNEY